MLFGGGTLTYGDWQIGDVHLQRWPHEPATFFGIGGCGGDQNYNGSCNPKASALLKKAQFTADPADRAKLLNAAEQILADDVYVIPLFARPTTALSAKRVKGVLRNPTQQGSTWNAETWSVTS